MVVLFGEIMRTLVIVSHPNLDSSVANNVIIDHLKKSSSLIKIRHLDSLYLDYKIDVIAEQAELLLADTIVFQFPFYWYSSPAMLKHWLDQVLTFNFAYGPQGDKLKGKNLLISTTIGGPQSSYQPLGYNHFQVTELLRPFEQTAYLTGMNYLSPIFTHGCVYIPGVYNTKEEVEESAHTHAKRVLEFLAELSKESL